MKVHSKVPEGAEGGRTPRPTSRPAHMDLKRTTGTTSLVPGVTKASIRRLARRAGVKRVGGDFYEDAETGLRSFLSGLVKDIYVMTEYARRRTATLNDVLLVLKRNGR